MSRKSRRELEQTVEELSETTESVELEDTPVFAYRNSDGDLVDEQGRRVEGAPIFGVKGGPEE